jgi:hypothetical protein
MPYYDDEEFYDLDEFDFEEFGDTKKKKKVVKKQILPTFKIADLSQRRVVKRWRPTFNKNALKQRQSTNIIDLGDTNSLNVVNVEGVLTWNTYWHLAANVSSNLKTALTGRGFSVGSVNTFPLFIGSSDYFFLISLNVKRQYAATEVSRSILKALKDVAIPSSIRITQT